MGELKYFDIVEAKKAYSEGKNITELLRTQKNLHTNTAEINALDDAIEQAEIFDRMLKKIRPTPICIPPNLPKSSKAT